MANALLYYLIAINVVTFLVYGIDKAASQRGQSQTRLSYAELDRRSSGRHRVLPQSAYHEAQDYLAAQQLRRTDPCPHG